MKLYHVTDEAGADAILRNGFRDVESSSGVTSIWLLGVLVSDEPLVVTEGDRVVEVVLPDSHRLENELVEAGKGYREWCLPAAVLNGWPRRRLDMDEVHERSADLFEGLLQARGDPFKQDAQAGPSNSGPVVA